MTDWIDGGHKLKTTGSVSIDGAGNYVSSYGSDIYFYISGSTTQKVVFGGDVYVSGTTATQYLSQSNVPLYSCFTTSSLTWSSAVWADFTSIATHISQTLANGISRTGSSFTVNRTGYYQFYSYFNSYGTSNYLSFRVSGSNGTLTQRTCYAVGQQHRSIINDVFHLTSGSSIKLQYCQKNGTASTWSPESIDGENMVTGNLFIRYIS